MLVTGRHRKAVAQFLQYRIRRCRHREQREIDVGKHLPRLFPIVVRRKGSLMGLFGTCCDARKIGATRRSISFRESTAHAMRANLLMTAPAGKLDMAATRRCGSGYAATVDEKARRMCRRPQRIVGLQRARAVARSDGLASPVAGATLAIEARSYYAGLQLNCTAGARQPDHGSTDDDHALARPRADQAGL